MAAHSHQSSVLQTVARDDIQNLDAAHRNFQLQMLPPDEKVCGTLHQSVVEFIFVKDIIQHSYVYIF